MDEIALFRAMLAYAKQAHDSDEEALEATREAFALICDSPGAAARLAEQVEKETDA